jgi:hypothetical protein
VQAHGIAAARIGVALGVGVKEVEHAALADHGVVVEVLFEAFPELHRPLVEGDVASQQVVGADDGGVAADVAAPEPALLQHGDVRHPMLLGEVVGGGEPMPPAADDDDVVRRLQLGIAPHWRPAGVAAQRLADDGKNGIAHVSLSNPASSFAPNR